MYKNYYKDTAYKQGPCNSCDYLDIIYYINTHFIMFYFINGSP